MRGEAGRGDRVRMPGAGEDVIDGPAVDFRRRATSARAARVLVRAAGVAVVAGMYVRVGARRDTRVSTSGRALRVPPVERRLALPASRDRSGTLPRDSEPGWHDGHLVPPAVELRIVLDDARDAIKFLAHQVACA